MRKVYIIETTKGIVETHEGKYWIRAPGHRIAVFSSRTRAKRVADSCRRLSWGEGTGFLVREVVV